MHLNLLIGIYCINALKSYLPGGLIAKQHARSDASQVVKHSLDAGHHPVELTNFTLIIKNSSYNTQKRKTIQFPLKLFQILRTL